MAKVIVCPHIAISTPFVSYDDQVRVQMAASQCRQAVPLVENEPPIVETTLERSRILEPDIIRARQNCIVVFSDTRILVVRNEDGNYDIHRVTYVYKLPKEGQEFKEGEVIAYKLGYFDEHGNLAQGKNLKCAIMIHPWCYEDSIVLGDHVNLTSYKYHVIEKFIPSNSILLSLDKNKYKIIPDIGEKIKAFQPFLLIKKNDPNRIIEDPEEVYINEDSEVIEVEIVGNKWNTNIREYDVAILEYLQQKEKLAQKIDKVIDDEYIRNEIKRYLNLFEYSKLTQNPSTKKTCHIKYGKNPFDLYIRIVLRSERKIEEGDKISNRHANKGVISKITSEMPVIKNTGEKIDVIVDVMGIPSRMNIGQVYEIIAASCISNLKRKIQEFQDLEKAKDYILEFYKIIDNTHEKWITKQCQEQIKNINNLQDLSNLELTFPAPPFDSSTRDQIIEVCKFLNPDLEKNIHIYFESHKYKNKPKPDLSPILELVEYNGKEIYVTAGDLYFYKLIHMSREKISARGTGKIMKKTMQPTAGRRNQGGQRFGEYEIWCLLAYNALLNLQEVIRLKSDDIQQKVNYMLSKLYDSNISFKSQEIEVVKLFKSYLKILRTELKEE